MTIGQRRKYRRVVVLTMGVVLWLVHSTILIILTTSPVQLLGTSNSRSKKVKLCQHDNYTIIDWIHEPRYHDDRILIKTTAITSGTEHYLIKFTNSNKYKDWFYMSKKVIVNSPTQKNGRGRVYCVPMSKRDTFVPDKQCKHNQGILL